MRNNAAIGKLGFKRFEMQPDCGVPRSAFATFSIVELTLAGGFPGATPFGICQIQRGG